MSSNDQMGNISTVIAEIFMKLVLYLTREGSQSATSNFDTLQIY